VNRAADLDQFYFGLEPLIGGLFLLVVFFAFLKFGALWFRGAHVGCASQNGSTELQCSCGVLMRREVVKAKIMAHQAGIQSNEKSGIATQNLEAHYLAGGDIDRVTQAIIAAERANIDLDFDRAAAIDLAGRDVLEAVKTSVYPRVIECPDRSFTDKSTLSAISKDGIELRVRARVTVRTNLDQLIGGATEETIIARVGRGDHYLNRLLERLFRGHGNARPHLESGSRPRPR
jgi:uncharacterized protein YqfA (UPF0365 family)